MRATRSAPRHSRPDNPSRPACRSARPASAAPRSLVARCRRAPSVAGRVWVGGAASRSSSPSPLSGLVPSLHALPPKVQPSQPVGRRASPEIADAQIDRQVRRAAAREIADEQVERQRLGPHRGVLGPVTLARIVGRRYSSTLNDSDGVDRLVADDHLQVVIAHRRALRRGPARSRRCRWRRSSAACRTACPIRDATGAACPSSAGAIAEARADGVRRICFMWIVSPWRTSARSNTVWRMSPLAPSHRAGRNHRADALAPARQGEAEIAALARRDHQRMRSLPLLAAAIGFRLGQALRRSQARRWHRSCRARAISPGAAVGDRTSAPATGLPLSSAVTQASEVLAAPFEMHRHVGDERAGGDIARRLAAEQRLAEHRAGQLDDIEAGLLPAGCRRPRNPCPCPAGRA
jgi:hypothetical protein